MQYFITFLEGVISFISPCMLPLLPVYISFFAGDADKKEKTFLRALSFVIGFSLVFCLLGLFAGQLGSFLRSHETALNILSGAVVILFGLSFLGVFRLPAFKTREYSAETSGIIPSFLFGLVYAVNLTPCIGAFLGSALMMAGASGTAAKGLLLLVTYSLGMAIPFLLSALLIDRLAKGFGFIKKHYDKVELLSGIFLILVGLLMMTGLMGRFMSLLG